MIFRLEIDTDGLPVDEIARLLRAAAARVANGQMLASEHAGMLLCVAGREVGRASFERE